MAGADTSADNHLLAVLLKQALLVAGILVIAQEPPEGSRQRNLPTVGVACEHEHIFIIGDRIEFHRTVAEQYSGAHASNSRSRWLHRCNGSLPTRIEPADPEGTRRQFQLLPGVPEKPDRMARRGFSGFPFVAEKTTLSRPTVVIIAHHRPDAALCLQVGEENQGILGVCLPGDVVTGEKDEIRVEFDQDFLHCLFSPADRANVKVSEVDSGFPG